MVRERSGRSGGRLVWGGGALLVGALAVGGFGSAAIGVGAQDESLPADGERLASIAAGNCGNNLGDVVADLTPLGGAAGDAVGNEAAVTAESSFTNVPLSLDEILADDHAIDVALGGDDDASIACGEIGGAIGDDGTLVVGLREQERSGYAGIAFLAPEEDGTTSVSVFVAEVLAPVEREANPDRTPNADRERDPNRERARDRDATPGADEETTDEDAEADATAAADVEEEAEDASDEEPEAEPTPDS